MRVHSFSSWLQQLFFSMDQHQSGTYWLIATPDDQQFFKEELEVVLGEKYSHIPFSTVEPSLDESLDRQFYSLLSEERVLFIRVPEKKRVDTWFEKSEGVPQTQLIIFSTDSKSLQSIPAEQQRNWTLFDLGEEKPWDRKKRLLHWGKSFLEKSGQAIPMESLEEVYRYCGEHPLFFRSELNKVALFFGDRKKTAAWDSVKPLLSDYREMSSWKLAHQIIWDRKVEIWPLDEEESFWLSLLGPARYEIQLGEALFHLKQKRMAPEDLKIFFPHLRPAQMERYQQKLPSVSLGFFENAQKQLLELEFQLKSQSLSSAELLWLMFFHQLQAYDIAPLAQSTAPR